jgi:hypothetical protein
MQVPPRESNLKGPNISLPSLPAKAAKGMNMLDSNITHPSLHPDIPSDDDVAQVKDIPFHKRTFAATRKLSLDQLYARSQVDEKLQQISLSPQRTQDLVPISIPLRTRYDITFCFQSPANTISSHQREVIVDGNPQELSPTHQPMYPSPNQENFERVSRSSTMSSGSDSPVSYTTNATSLPGLQQRGLDEHDQLEPLIEEQLDPGSFDLVIPPIAGAQQYSLETRSEELFSGEHLKIIFSDPSLLLRFTAFLRSHRSSSIPILIYYLDAIKALKAIRYSNAIAEALDPIDGIDFTNKSTKSTVNEELEEKARLAFDVMVRDDLPAYITHVFIQTVSLSIQKRITGTLPEHLREASEGLAEVFCLTDPTRPDNPIVFSSEGATHIPLPTFILLTSLRIPSYHSIWNDICDWKKL